MDPSDRPHVSPATADTISLLLERLHFGDPQSAEALMRRAEPLARTVCRFEARELPSCQVEELVQEALLVVWAKRSTFDPERGRFESWVRGICRMLCNNERRRKRDVLTEDGVLEGTSPEQSALRQMREAERKRILTEAIEALVEQDQDVLSHRYIHERPHSEIAELMGIDVERVRVLLQNASRRLRRALHQQLEALGHSFFHSISEQFDAPPRS